jgi:hypothetical protein
VGPSGRALELEAGVTEISSGLLLGRTFLALWPTVDRGD